MVITTEKRVGMALKHTL